MEDTALEDAQPASGQLEAQSGDDRRVSAMSRAKAPAFRLPVVRHI